MTWPLPKKVIFFVLTPIGKKDGTGLARITGGKSSNYCAQYGTTNGIDISPMKRRSTSTKVFSAMFGHLIWRPTAPFPINDFCINSVMGGMDGMRCDAKGNLYITRHGKGEVAVVSPEGKVIKTIKTKGKSVSNICFGGKKGRTCYITLQDRGCLETFQADAPGREWVMMKAFMEKK